MTKLYKVISPYLTGTRKLVEKGAILSGSALGAQVGELLENGNIEAYAGPPPEADATEEAPPALPAPAPAPAPAAPAKETK